MKPTTDYQQALLDEIKDIPEEALPNVLKIVKLFKESLLAQTRQGSLALQRELEGWSQLSDEALTAFEKNL